MAIKYLVSADGEDHLPVTGDDGKPDHRLMGAAWNALRGRAAARKPKRSPESHGNRGASKMPGIEILCFFVIVVIVIQLLGFVVILLQGFGWHGFHLSDAVLIELIRLLKGPISSCVVVATIAIRRSVR